MSSITFLGRWLLLGSLLLFLGLPTASGIILKIKTPESCSPGVESQIYWTIENEGPHSFNNVDFYLMNYSYDQFNVIHIIAQDLDIMSTNSIVWQVPLEFAPEQQYFICAYASDVNYKSCSGFFWILADYCRNNSDNNG